MNRLLKIGYALWLEVRTSARRLFSRQGPLRGSLLLKDGKTPLPFIDGVNLPWIRYGGDFGANAWSPEGGVSRPGGRDALRRHFQELQAQGMRTVRWFLFCDGRAGIRFTAAGTPIGLDPFVFADVDAALETAAACGLRIIFVLLDFLWCSEAQQVNSVQVRGRSRVLSYAAQQRALRRRVFRPVLKRYGRSPAILAWDIINEPEWSTRGFGGVSPAAVPFLTMRRFIKRTVRLVHRCTGQLATVGLGNAAGLPLVRDCGLDFYQVHWYDRWESVAPLDRPVAELGLDRPLLLGEFPTRNSSRPQPSIVAAAKSSGYCGALAWSLLAGDSSSAIDPDGGSANA